MPSDSAVARTSFLATALCLLGLLVAAPAAAASASATASPTLTAETPYRLGPTQPGGKTTTQTDSPEALARPARVVTLAPSITEIVLALGGADRLVGVSRFDDATEVGALPRVGGFLDPVPEKILGLRPDLLIVQPSPGNRSPVERLASLGIPVLVLPLHTTAEILSSVQAVGDALGLEEQGQALARRLEREMLAIRQRNQAHAAKTTLVVYTWQPLVVAGSGSFADELLLLVGGRNAAAGASGAYPTLSAEAALASDPEVIIDASGGHGAGKPLPGWQERVVVPRSNALFRPGPRLIEALLEMETLLHGRPGPP